MYASIWNFPQIFCQYTHIQDLKDSHKVQLFKIGIHMYYVCVSHIWLCDPMNCSPPGSSVHGILPAGILSGLPRDQTLVSCIAGRFLTIWTTREEALNMCISVLDCYKLYFVSIGQLLLEKVNLSHSSFIKDQFSSKLSL